MEIRVGEGVADLRLSWMGGKFLQLMSFQEGCLETRAAAKSFFKILNSK